MACYKSKRFDDIIMSGMSGKAISDRMRYGIKPSAVRSENLLHYYKANNGSSFDVAVGNEMIFQVPALGGGHYIDWSTSYFRAHVQIDLGGVAGADGYVRFERGPESMFRRLQFMDATGAILENFENYNDMYAIQELCTNNANNRSGPNVFHGEGLQIQNNLQLVMPDLPLNAAPTTTQLRTCIDTMYIRERPFSTDLNEGTNLQMPVISYPHLGSIVVMRHTSAAVAANDICSGFPEKIGAWDLRQAVGTEEFPGCIANRKGGKYITFQLSSALFGGSAEKYLPMSAINGMRIVFGFENVLGAFCMCGLTTAGAVINFQTMTVKVVDPTMFLNLIAVPSHVDYEILYNAAMRDNLIRIHSHTWTSFYQYLPAGTMKYNWIIPIKASSLKAIYFVFSYATYTGIDNYTTRNQDSYVADAAGVRTYTNHNNGPGALMKTSFYPNNMKSYQFFVGGKPNPSVPIFMRTGFSEVIAELSRALHFGHKSSDGSYLSLLGKSGVGCYNDGNCIFGQEFETFSNKGPMLESGMNTLSTDVAINLEFTTAGSAFNSYLKVFCMYDVFLDIDKDTGIMKVET